MRVKRVAVVLVAFCLIVSVAACSGAGGQKEGAPANEGKGSTKDKMVITLFDLKYGEIPPKDGKGIAMINEKFNVDYRPQYVPYEDFEEKLATLVASGNIPDIIGFDHPSGNFFKWVKQGAFLPLDDYIVNHPTLKNVPEHVWDSMKVNGHIYAIPRYFPAYHLRTPIIRKDWLDKLGLSMPTNYEELKEVAIAFTKQDPNGSGKDDTYGLVLSENINPSFAFGAYWDGTAWYHKDKDGQLIPGHIAEGSKERIAWLADLYKRGAVNKDFAVMSYKDSHDIFFSGKGGIYAAQAYNQGKDPYESLAEIDPEAELAAIPPFEAPDGTQGYTASSSYYQMTALSAELASDPDKVTRILEMIDFGRRYYPLGEHTPDNKDYDWYAGREGSGYQMKDGKPVGEGQGSGLAPKHYLPDERPWPPDESKHEFAKGYEVPIMKVMAGTLENMHNENAHYLNPFFRIYSEKHLQKGAELDQFLLGEQTKMIAGQKPLAEWDEMVQQYLQKGGADIVKEVNEALKSGNISGEWEK